MIFAPARLRKFTRSESGASIVEFAILAPVLVLLLIGIIEMSRFAYFALLASNAARAGASYGAQNTYTALDSAGMRTAALNDSQSLTGLSASPKPLCYVDNTQTTCSLTQPKQSNWTYYVEVDTSGSFKSIFKYPGIPQNVPVSGKSIMRVADQ